jgi:PHP family Zn ribbon phosphoesterase
MKQARCEVCGLPLEGAVDLKEGRCPNCGGVISKGMDPAALAREALEDGPAEAPQEEQA